MHAVRARPLQTIKNNIEPDEHCEEADTIPPRGVNPESRAAPGLRPALYPSVGLVATLLGLGGVWIHVQGLTPLPILFRPTRGLKNWPTLTLNIKYLTLNIPSPAGVA